MYGYIYKFTLIPTGLIYVGKRCRSEFDENYFGSGTKWLRAINYFSTFKEDYKYLITREILQWANSPDELNLLERYWIKKLNSQDSLIGYNISSGGEFTNTCEGYHWFHNDVEEIQVSSDEIEFIDKDEWILGRLPGVCNNSGKGYIWINNGLSNKTVPKNELMSYINLGWVKGMLDRGDEWRSHLGKFERSDECRKICSETSKKTISEGRNKGWLDNQFKKGQIPHNKNKFWITNGIINHYINYDEEIPDGWRKGCTQNRKSKKRSI